MRRRRKKPLIPILLLFCIFLGGSLYIADQQLGPILSALAKQRIHMVAVRHIQEAAQKQLAEHEEYQNYQELMYIERDQEGHIILMVPNTMKINQFISEITLDAETALCNIPQDEVSIPFGAITGSRLFSNWGPHINIDVTPISTINTEIIDDFTSAGINQTRHRIWLQISTDLGIAVPFDKETIEVKTSFLLTEGIIVGPIPDTYLNFSTN